jgi:hypothetical protein
MLDSLRLQNIMQQQPYLLMYVLEAPNEINSVTTVQVYSTEF